MLSSGVQVNTKEIRRMTEILLSTVDNYLNEFPAKAFETFKRLMQLLEKTPLKTYYKSLFEQMEMNHHNDPLNLFRISCVSDNIPYTREKIFHTPYYLRSKDSVLQDSQIFI